MININYAWGPAVAAGTVLVLLTYVYCFNEIVAAMTLP